MDCISTAGREMTVITDAAGTSASSGPPFWSASVSVSSLQLLFGLQSGMSTFIAWGLGPFAFEGFLLRRGVQGVWGLVASPQLDIGSSLVASAVWDWVPMPAKVVRLTVTCKPLEGLALMVGPASALSSVVGACWVPVSCLLGSCVVWPRMVGRMWAEQHYKRPTLGS